MTPSLQLAHQLCNLDSEDRVEKPWTGDHALPPKRSYLDVLLRQDQGQRGNQKETPGEPQSTMNTIESKAQEARPYGQKPELLQSAEQMEPIDLKKKWMEKMETLKASVKMISSPSLRKAFALDCEMVAVRPPGSVRNVHKAAWVSVVDSEGYAVYETHISQKYPIHNCFTWISGIKRFHLRGAPSLEEVQEDLYHILGGNILVGHSLEGDLKSLEMHHPIADQRDTQTFFERNLPYGETKTNLKLMAYVHLDQEIQQSSHSPVDDAVVTMDLYLLYRDPIDAQAMYYDS